jgi:hypothetical protein
MRVTKLRVVVGVCVALAFAAQAVPASADTNSVPICSSPGTALSGNTGSFTVTGNAYVASDATLNVNGNLTLAPGACLDAFSLGTVTVSGGISVGQGATLGLGCSPGAIGPQPPCGFDTTKDTVGGNIIANAPLTMYLTAVTVGGNVVSNGGGPGPTLNPYINFPVKENNIGGNLIMQGWQGAWLGALRNNVGGNLIVQNNVGVTHGDEGTPDSTEIVNNTVGGNLICHGNSPAAQVGDSGGGPNTARKKIGECASL